MLVYTNIMVTQQVRKSRDERRREIIEAMLDLVAKQGADRVTTRMLASRLGVTEPALYRHFPAGKPQMWRALSATLGEIMERGWARAQTRVEQSPSACLRGLIRVQMQTIVDVPALPAILFSRALHRDNAALRAAVGEIAARFHARVVTLIQHGQQASELRADVDADASAWLLISVVQGTAIRWSLGERDFDLVEEGTGVLDVALTGLHK